MKKTLFFLLVISLLGGCSSQKKTNNSTFLKGFFTYYNTLFNSKEALNAEIDNRDKSHKDNFYDSYIPLLTYDDQPLESGDGTGKDVFSNSNADFGNTGGGPGIPGGRGRSQNAGAAGARSGASILEISEAKALKAIAKYSVLRGGVERNKTMFDAHILLAQSRIYQNKPLAALDALNYIFQNMPKDKRLPLAKIYQGLAYSKMEDYARAEEVFADLKASKLKKYDRKLLSVYYSEMLLHAGKKQQAADELENAYVLNKNRKLRSRIAFLRGQILSELGQKEEARESFVTAYKNSNSFEFEVKSQVEIAKTFNGNEDEYAGAKAYLEKISKKGTYTSRKNEFYYALGLMAAKAGKKEEAKGFFEQSIKEKMSDPQIRGLSYYEMGKSYFTESDYLPAGAYYDSALAVMTHEPSKIILKEKSENIKQVSTNYYLVKKNDSILALVNMPESERMLFFAKLIDGIKDKEQKEELERQKAERSKGFDTGDYSANSIFAGNAGGFQEFGGGKGGFYFANNSTVAKGESTFRQIWGQRSLADNWRTSIRSNTIEDLKSQAMGVTTAPNPRRLEPAFYIEQIPNTEAEIQSLKKARDTASLGLGRMYEAYFSDTPLATKTLYNLVDHQPESDVKLQALYQIFSYNYEKNPTAAERAKTIILEEFPYTSYAEFVKNPKNSAFAKSTEEVEKAYEDAYNYYAADKFEESKATIESALLKYPKDALVPKFELLNAFNTGKTAGKEVMILQLEQIALNYPRTREGEKAAEMLKYLKSELQIEQTDDDGNAVSAVPRKVVEETAPLQGVEDSASAPLKQGSPGRPEGIGTPPLQHSRERPGKSTGTLKNQ